jgi:hypothetical protein
VAKVPRNLAVPLSLLAIVTCVLLILVTAWLWNPSQDDYAPMPATTEGREVRSEETAPRTFDAVEDQAAPEPETTIKSGVDPEPTDVASPVPQDAVSDAGTGLPAPDTPYRPPTASKAAAPGGRSDLRGGAAPSPKPGGAPGSGGSGPGQADGASGFGAESAGSTFVAIPPDRTQPAEPAPESQAEPEEETAEEIPIEQAEEPEPLSESPSTEEGDRREPEKKEEPSPSTPTVQLIPDVQELSVGEHLAVVVMISGASDVGHVPFHLLYDPRVLQFEYGEEGSFLRSDGRQTAFFASAASGGGEVVVGLSRFGGGEGVSGEGLLCILHFAAVGPGSSAISFSREKVRDAANQIVPSFFIATEVTVH